MRRLIYMLAAVLLVGGVVEANEFYSVVADTPTEQPEQALTFSDNSQVELEVAANNIWTHVKWNLPLPEGQTDNNGLFKSVNYTYTLAGEGETFEVKSKNEAEITNGQVFEPIEMWNLRKNGTYTLTFEATWNYTEDGKEPLKTKNVVKFDVTGIINMNIEYTTTPTAEGCTFNYKITWDGMPDGVTVESFKLGIVEGQKGLDDPVAITNTYPENGEGTLDVKHDNATLWILGEAILSNGRTVKLPGNQTIEVVKKTEGGDTPQPGDDEYKFKLNVSYENTYSSLTVTCEYEEVNGKEVPAIAEYDLEIGMEGANIPEQKLSNVRKTQIGNGKIVYEYPKLVTGTDYHLWVNGNRQKVKIDGKEYVAGDTNVYINGEQKSDIVINITKPTAAVTEWETATEAGAFFTDDPTSPRGGKLNFKIKYSNPDHQPVAALRLAAAMAAADAVEGLEYEVWGLGTGAELTDKIFGLVRIDNPDDLVDADGWINVEMWLSKLPYIDGYKQLYMKSAIVMEDGTIVVSNGSDNAGYQYKKPQPVQPTVGYTGAYTFTLDAGNTETSRNGMGELNFDYNVTNPDAGKFSIDKVELYATMEKEQIVDFDETKYPLWDGSSDDKPRYIVASRVINGADITNVNAVSKGNFTLSGLPNDDARVYMRSKITYTENGETNTVYSGYYDYYILDARSPRTLPMPVRFILNENYPINISDRSMLAKVEVMSLADVAEAEKANYVADVDFKSLPLQYKYEVRKVGEENWTLVMDHGQQDIIDYIELEPGTEYEAKVTISGFTLYENQNTTFVGSDTYKFTTTADVTNTYRKQVNGTVSHPADPVWYPAGAENIKSSVDNVITLRDDFTPFQTEPGLYYTQKINAVDISQYEDLFYKFSVTGPKRDAAGNIIPGETMEIWFNTQVKQPQATAWIPLKGDNYDFTQHEGEEVKITFKTNTDFRAGGLVAIDPVEYKIGEKGDVKPGAPASIAWIIETPEINRVWSEYDNQITHIQAHLLDENGLILDEESKNIQYEILDFKTLTTEKVAVKTPAERNHELWGLHFNCNDTDDTVKDIVVNAYYTPAAPGNVTSARLAAPSQHAEGTLEASRNFHYMSMVATGVDEIGDEVEDAEPVFFNLQGMKVVRPAKGQIYIMVRGNKSSKVMF